jgi:hypothetical protein
MALTISNHPSRSVTNKPAVDVETSLTEGASYQNLRVRAEVFVAGNSRKVATLEQVKGLNNWDFSKLLNNFIGRCNAPVGGSDRLISPDLGYEDDIKLSQAFVPALVRNNEVNNLVASSGTNLIEITAVNGSVITVNYLPESAFKTGIDWFALDTDSFNGAYPDPNRVGDYHTHSKIVSFNFSNKEIELVNVTDFSVGNHLAIYSPWANYEFLPNQENAGIVSFGGGGWRDVYVVSGPSWYNEEEDRYYVIVNGRSASTLQMGYAYCDDLTINNWIMGNSDAPIIENGDDSRFANRVAGTGNIMDNGDGTVSFLLNGTDSGGNWNISVCTMKKDTSEISFSSILDTTDQLYSGNSIVYYDGKYTILGTIHNVTVNQRTVEMWQSNTIDSGYTKTCDVFTTEYDNNDSIWMEGHSDGSCVFVENGALYSLQAGTQRYNASGLKGNRIQGLMKYDDDTNSWSPVNHFAPEIIHPMYFSNISSEDYGWASDHCGGNQSFIKKDGKCYFFVTMNHGTDTYQIAALELSNNIAPKENTTELLKKWHGSGDINTFASTDNEITALTGNGASNALAKTNNLGEQQIGDLLIMGIEYTYTNSGSDEATFGMVTSAEVADSWPYVDKAQNRIFFFSPVDNTFQYESYITIGGVSIDVTLLITINKITDFKNNPGAYFRVKFSEVYENSAGVTTIGGTAATDTLLYLPAIMPTGEAFTTNYLFSGLSSKFLNKGARNGMKFINSVGSEMRVLFATDEPVLIPYDNQNGSGSEHVGCGWGILVVNDNIIQNPTSPNIQVAVFGKSGEVTTSSLSENLHIYLDNKCYDDMQILTFVGDLGEEIFYFTGGTDKGYKVERESMRKENGIMKHLSTYRKTEMDLYTGWVDEDLLPLFLELLSTVIQVKMIDTDQTDNVIDVTITDQAMNIKQREQLKQHKIGIEYHE